MGASLSVDVVVLIARELSVDDVLAAASTCRAWRALEAPPSRFWMLLFAQRFGHDLHPPPGLPWKAAYRAVHGSACVRFDPGQAFGGAVLVDNTLFLTSGVRDAPTAVRDKAGTPLPFCEMQESEHMPSGWRLARCVPALHSCARVYAECKLLWTNKAYGDIIFGISDVSRGVQGTVSDNTDTCASWGLYFNAGGRRASVFSAWPSSWDMGGFGPAGERFEVPSIDYPFVMSVLFDRAKRVCSFAWNGTILTTVRLPADSRMQLFVIMYSDASHAQLLHPWEYPELASSFLFAE